MELQDFLNLISRKRQTIITIVLVSLIVSAAISLVQPLKYSVNTKLLVLQNYSSGTDPYNFSRSNEYLSGVLAQVVSSNSFFNKVIESGFQIDQTYFGDNAKDKMKEWNKTVSARAVSDTGFIEISVYHTNKQQASQIAQAVNYVMKTQHQEYHGSGSGVTIKTVNDPIASNWPVQPNIPLNLLLALVFGLIIGLSYIYILPDDKYDLKFMPHKRKKKIAQKGETIEYFSPEQASNKIEQNDNPEVKAESLINREPLVARHESKSVNFNGNINNLI